MKNKFKSNLRMKNMWINWKDTIMHVQFNYIFFPICKCNHCVPRCA